jgi:hypothetical protein
MNAKRATHFSKGQIAPKKCVAPVIMRIAEFMEPQLPAQRRYQASNTLPIFELSLM